tara:strand:+ start:1063 stop:1395 length:333 start_codon:yes stop_codon:yes gene_type:complete
MTKRMTGFSPTGTLLMENEPTEIIHKAVTVKAPVKAAPATQDDIAAIMLVIKNQRSVMLQEFEEKFDRIFEKAFNKAFTKALNNGAEICALEKVIEVLKDDVDEQAEDHE